MSKLTESQVRKEATHYNDHVDAVVRRPAFRDDIREREERLRDQQLSRLSSEDRRRVENEALRQQLEGIRYRTQEEWVQREAESKKEARVDALQRAAAFAREQATSSKAPPPGWAHSNMSPDEYVRNHGRLQHLPHGPSGGKDYLEGSEPASLFDRRPRIYGPDDVNIPAGGHRWSNGGPHGVRKPTMPGGGGR